MANKSRYNIFSNPSNASERVKVIMNNKKDAKNLVSAIKSIKGGKGRQTFKVSKATAQLLKS